MHTIYTHERSGVAIGGIILGNTRWLENGKRRGVVEASIVPYY